MPPAPEINNVRVASRKSKLACGPIGFGVPVTMDGLVRDHAPFVQLAGFDGKDFGVGDMGLQEGIKNAVTGAHTAVP